MSTPSPEIKAAAAAETLTLEQRIRALEADAKSWYEKHVPLLAGAALVHFL